MRFWLLCCILLLLGSCKDAVPVAPVDGQLPAYLISHTSGVISREAEIVVTFDSLPANLVPELSFSPAVTGETRRSGSRLLFRPAQHLASGTAYVATLRVPDYPDYSFSFRTPERRLSVATDGYYLSGTGRSAETEIRGRVSTNDGATIAEIRDVLTVTYAGGELETRVEQSAPNLFTFTATVPSRVAEPARARIALRPGGGFAGAGESTEVQIDPPGTLPAGGSGPGPGRERTDCLVQ